MSASMSEIPEDLFYTEDHEWLRIDGNMAIVGITDHAQDALTDIVYVELPEVGSSFAAGEEFASVESVKSVSGIYIPVDGEVVEANEELEDAPELINSDPYGEGWIAKISLADGWSQETLLDAAGYRSVIGA